MIDNENKESKLIATKTILAKLVSIKISQSFYKIFVIRIHFAVVVIYVYFNEIFSFFVINMSDNYDFILPTSRNYILFFKGIYLNVVEREPRYHFGLSEVPSFSE